MRLIDLPEDLKRVIDGENVDFAVKAKRNNLASSGIGLIFFGLFWSAFTSIFVVAFFGPLFKGEEVHFTANDVPQVGSIDNLASLLLPGMFIGFFVLIGLAMIFFGLKSLFDKGGYFVGTGTRLIQYRKRTIKMTNWEQFSGNIVINNKEGDGDITLELRTGSMQTKNDSDKYVPDKIYISGIPNVFEIEKLCRTRIKENNPGPGKKLENA